MEGTLSEKAIPAAQDAPGAPRPRPALRRRPWMSSVLLLVLLAIAWEVCKLLFSISDQKLPHLSAIAATFFDRPRGDDGPLRATLLLGSAATTLGEAILGFGLGGLLGCGLAVVFAGSRLLERSLLPYVVGS
jgi:ABC-type nitrate/sulfonate/bicarbonate transport system permease component